MEKCNVNNEKGGRALPSYEFLKRKSGVLKVSWNFVKFLVDQNGQVDGIFNSNTLPNDMVP